MELEQVKAAWQREKAMYFHEVDPKAILADTKQKAMKRHRDFNRQQMTQILCGLLCLGMMASGYRRADPPISNAGLVLMLLCLALMLAGSVILKYRLRVSHPWLPEKEFVAEEREKIAARIALLRRNVKWFLIPALLGFVAWQAGLAHSAKMVIALVVVATLACAGIFWFYRWKLRKDLLPILEDIDRELEYFRNSSKSRPE
jgi:putative effector of murein hydrolase LrgA (UPF0299 family)